MDSLPLNILVMKVGPHSNMSLSEIIKSKRDEELLHGVHYWGYSGVFCQPKPTKEFCYRCIQETGTPPLLVLIETKSPYHSTIGEIRYYSPDNIEYHEFMIPVQLQGAQFSFIARNLRVYKGFNINAYNVVGGKNDGKPLSEHLRFRINKSFATLNKSNVTCRGNITQHTSVLVADLVDPFAIWLQGEVK